MPPRLVLAIENANPSMPNPGVAVGRWDGRLEVLAHEPIAPSTRPQDDLVAAMDRACRGAGVAPRDIGLVGVSVGPGGYTAMRMSVAAGKMLAEVAGARCIAVPSPCSIVAALRESLPPGPLLVLMAG